jgi:hypothetical protein
MSFSQFILEGQNENNAKAKLKKAGKEEDYEKLLSITEPFKGTTQGKNNKHLPKLVEFYLSGIPLNTIQDYYVRFIKNDAIHNKPIDKMEFKDFEQLVDSTATKLDIDNKEIDDKPIYEDDNVKIFLGDSKEKCIKYGQGRKYGFCISRSDSGNLYHGYRSGVTTGSPATFYFIYFKNKEAQGNAPENLVVIHAYPNDRYQINYATPNRDDNITKEEILKQFPALEPIFDKVIKFIPHSDKEKHIYEYIEKVKSITELKTLDDKLLFVEVGRKINDEDWNTLGNTQEQILAKYIEVGNYDIPHEFEQKYPKLWKRYIEKLKQRVNIKLSNRMIKSLTDDESKLFKDNPSIIEKETVNNMSIDDIEQIGSNIVYSEKVYLEPLYVMTRLPLLAHQYASQVLKWQNVPEEIITGISKSPNTAYNYAENILKWQNVPQEIITGISKDPDYAYKYASNVLKWQNVPQEIITGISKDPDYAYKYASNVLKWQNVPQETIEGLLNRPNDPGKLVRFILNWENVPPEIIVQICKEPAIAYKYSSNVKRWLDIPQSIYDSAKKYKDPPSNATVIPDQQPQTVNESFQQKIISLFRD